MGSKKRTKTKQIQAKKKKKKKKFFILSLILVICTGFLIFFFVSLFDYVYPPTTGTGVDRASREKIKTRLFFSDANERFLAPETRYISKEKTEREQAKQLITALIDGPKAGHVQTFPSETKLIDVSIQKDGTAIINFGKNMIDLHPGSSASEIMTIYSLTNTLTHNIPGIKRVALRVEGKKKSTLKGHIDMLHPFVMNRELNVKG